MRTYSIGNVSELYVQKYLQGRSHSVNCNRDIKRNILCNYYNYYIKCYYGYEYYGRPGERHTYDDLRLTDMAQLFHAE